MKLLKDWILVFVVVFGVFFIAAIIFSTNYDSNDTDLETIEGITPMMIGPILSDLERQFGYEMSERQTVTGAYVYDLTNEYDHIKVSVIYQLASGMGVSLLILENKHHPDSTMSRAAIYFAESIVSLPYKDAQPDSALNWFRKNRLEQQAGFTSGNGEFTISQIGANGFRFSMRGRKKSDDD